MRQDILAVTVEGDMPWMKWRGTAIVGSVDWFKPVIFRVKGMEYKSSCG